MQISRISADANLDVLRNALAARNPEASVFNRFAIVTAKVGEGSQRAFLVEATTKDKDVGLLKTTGPDKTISLTTKDAAGNDVRVTGQVSRYVEIGNATAHRWNLIASAAGIVTAGWMSAVTALNGLPAHMPANGWVVGALGALAVYGSVVAFGRAVVKINDGPDWAGLTAKALCESAAVPVEIEGISKAPVEPPALPAPSPIQSPFILPIVVQSAEKITV